MNKQIFRKNLKTSLDILRSLKNISENSKIEFTIKRDDELGKSHNSTDEYMRFWILSDTNIGGKKFSVEETIDLLSSMEPLFPLWIRLAILSYDSNIVEVNLISSCRFRKPSELKYKETGHSPFTIQE